MKSLYISTGVILLFLVTALLSYPQQPSQALAQQLPDQRNQSQQNQQSNQSYPKLPNERTIENRPTYYGLPYTGQPAPEPNPDHKPLHTPEEFAQACVDYLKANLRKGNNCYLRFLYDPGADPKDLKILNWTVNHLHFESAITDIKPIAANLWVLNIDDFGWSKEAFSTVVRRETYTREPLISPNLAAELRGLTKTDQDPETLHLEALVRADWFFRETMESDRSPSYYDLLFAKKRFNGTTRKFKEVKVWEDWPGGDYKGVYYAPGKYETIYKVPVNEPTLINDFPKNEKDFETIFGVDKARAFIRESKINLQHGAVVEGMEKGGSIVARQNRLIELTLGFIGPYYKTFDVDATTGQSDFTETLNKNFKFKAGEILTDTPCGALAALLVLQDGKIVEVADNRFATDTSDIKFDARVRTPGSCFICHESGYIEPKNMVDQMLRAGVDIRFYNRQDERDARSFFLHWERKLKFHQEGHRTFALRTSGYEPGERAAIFKAYRDRYDFQVDLKRAQIETGLTPREFEIAANNSKTTRIKNLIVGITMPRKTWEVDGFKEVILQDRYIHQKHRPKEAEK